MHWIAVHEEVLGSKLRGFRKKVKCSEAEALGVLTYMWLWARRNTDITGLLGNTDRDDIACMIKPVLSEKLNAETVTNALVECGWLDEIDGELYVHDWQEWQSYWYTYLDKREKDRKRKRQERERARKGNVEERPQLLETAQDAPENQSAEDGEEKGKKPKKPPKTKYAESVSMYPEEREKLVEQYGEEFTVKLIEELNNYKLSNGKRYKDDYRAILSWVVEKCEKKYSDLRIKAAKSKQTNGDCNPFSDYK